MVIFHSYVSLPEGIGAMGGPHGIAMARLFSRPWQINSALDFGPTCRRRRHQVLCTAEGVKCGKLPVLAEVL